MNKDPNAKSQGIPSGGLKTSERSQEAADANENAAMNLSPEEQMAAFEEDLKESDWGHQPC
jgi:hypothetical protein